VRLKKEREQLHTAISFYPGGEKGKGEKGKGEGYTML